MNGIDALESTLRRIDGGRYGDYKRLPRAVGGETLSLRIDHVQGDPFAAPSRLAVRAPLAVAGWAPADLVGCRGVALRDLLARRLAGECRAASRSRGSGKSGRFESDAPGQQVLETTAVVLDDEAIELRLRAGLPGNGRRIAGREAATMLLEVLPALARQVLLRSSWDDQEVRAHLDCVEDTRALRGQLADAGLVGFVADGALLPRRSGVDDRPLAHGAVPFRSPDSLRRSFTLPHGGAVSGMGVPTGVTLLVGGGYHGKSTVLRALEIGVYDHVPGDGRERVVALPDAVKVRAEDGRAVTGVDLRPFVRSLPGGRSTEAFSTTNASGSTSQAASMMEALEAGARCLLIDEDTSATNVMIRDARMQALIAPEHEPLTPFVDRARQLWTEHGVSTVVVMGGSGDWLDVADTVIGLEDYVPWDATERARAVVAERPTGRTLESGGAFGALPRRVPDGASLDPSRGRKDTALRSRGVKELSFGTETIELAAVEQLVHDGQVRAIARILEVARREHMGPDVPVSAVLDAVEERLEREGLDAFGDPVGDLTRPRRHEVAAALNRLRSLRLR